MLVLRRKVGERILVGDSIEITILRVHRSGVRLGFKAPPEVSICREEVRHKLEARAAEEAAEPAHVDDACEPIVLPALVAAGAPATAVH